jgi:putative transposase
MKTMNINDLFSKTMAQITDPTKASQILQPDNILRDQMQDLICINIRAAIQHKTNESPYFQTYFRFIHNLIKSNAFYIADNNLLCINADTKHTQPRVVLPVKLIKTAIEYVHKSVHRNHPGIHQTQKQIEYLYWWYKYSQDIRNYVSTCDECQLTKGTKRYNIGKLLPLRASTHGEIVHFDFAGPFHKSLNILVMVDNYTGAVMFKATEGQTAAIIVRALMNDWMPYHGLPRNFVTDRGAGFIAEINQRICEIFGINKLFTSRYHPQTNGKAERMVQKLKKQLRILNIQLNNSMTNDYTPAQRNLAIKQIKLLLPSIQFACNQRIRQFCNTSPHQMLYGRNLPTIENVALNISKLNDLKSQLNKSHKNYKSHYELVTRLSQQLSIINSQFDKDKRKYIIIMKRNFDKNRQTSLSDKFKIGDYVAYYIGDRSNRTRKLRQRFSGPWQIKKRININTYEISNENGSAKMCCHVQMLKKYNKEQFTPLIDYERSEKQKRKIINKQKMAKLQAKKKTKQLANRLKQNDSKKKHTQDTAEIGNSRQNEFEPIDS